MHYLGRGRHSEGINCYALALQHAGEFQEVAGFATGARADVSAIKFDTPKLFCKFALAGIWMAGDSGLEPRKINHHVVNELLVPIAFDRLVTRFSAVQVAAVIDERFGLSVEFKNSVLS